MDGVSDITMQTMQFALDGLTQRSQATANNIANVNTPGYQATSVSFESALANALASGTVPDSSQISSYAEAGNNNAQGNNVSMENEMVGAVKDQMTYQTMVEGFNYKVTIMKDAMGGTAA
jgi:flagellar basal-body rod protein FlgB